MAAFVHQNKVPIPFDDYGVLDASELSVKQCHLQLKCIGVPLANGVGAFGVCLGATTPISPILDRQGYGWSIALKVATVDAAGVSAAIAPRQ